MKITLWAVAALVCFSMQVPCFVKEGSVVGSLLADSSKLHPEEIRCLYPETEINIQLVFKLPYETDRSGVANLLFQNKETGKIHLLDTVKGTVRYCNSQLFSGKYDVILLYNNGKYIKYHDMVFEKNTNKAIDMKDCILQPADSESQYWLTLRTFNAATRKREFDNNHTATSENRVNGYIFDQVGIYDGTMMWNATIEIEGTDRRILNDVDGYFEFCVDAFPAVLKVVSPSYIFQAIEVTANSWIFLVMKNFHTWEDLRKSSTGPIRTTQ